MMCAHVCYLAGACCANVRTICDACDVPGSSGTPTEAQAHRPMIDRTADAGGGAGVVVAPADGAGTTLRQDRVAPHGTFGR
eukprot:1176837-Prorocentrum_minimum.AAC.4